MRIGTPDESGPFSDGPVPHLDRVLSWPRAAHMHAARGAFAAFLLSWPPLVMLATAQGGLPSLLADPITTARYALAVPLLILAETHYVPRLSQTLRHFADGGFVEQSDLPRFDALADSINRSLSSVWLELVVVIMAFGVSFGIVTLPGGIVDHGAWSRAVVGGHEQPSAAWWWRAGVSHPLFLVLGGRTLIRVALWSFALRALAKMKLRLVASHADLMGGLRFVTTSIFSFLPLAFITGMLVAARVAQGVLVEHHALWQFRYQVLAVIVFVCVVFAGPLMVFEKQLWRLRIEGLFTYGVLATRVGRRFETRWLPRGHEMTEDVLEQPDFSALIDLSGVVSNVRDSRLSMIDLPTITPLVATALVPFVPLVFTVVPFDQILDFVAKTVL